MFSPGRKYESMGVVVCNGVCENVDDVMHGMICVQLMLSAEHLSYHTILHDIIILHNIVWQNYR